MPQEPTVSVTVRISPELGAAIDAKSAELEASNGTTFSRADVVRMALSKYLGLVPENQAAPDQPQPTP